MYAPNAMMVSHRCDQAGLASSSRDISTEEPDSSTKMSISLSRTPSYDVDVVERSRSMLSLRISEEFHHPESISARGRLVVEHNYFECAVAFSIVVSSILLTLDRPSLQQGSFEVGCVQKRGAVEMK